MKIQEIKNTSSDVLNFQTEDGQELGLAPGRGVRDVRVSDAQLKKIRERAEVKMDLSEVKGLLD